MRKLLYTALVVLWGTSTHAIKLVNEYKNEVTFYLKIYREEPDYRYVSVSSTKLNAKSTKPKVKAVSLEWPIEEKIKALKEEGEKVNDMYICAMQYVTFGTYFSHRENEWRSIKCKELVRSPYRNGTYHVDRIRIRFKDYIFYDAVCTDLENLDNNTIKIERHLQPVHGMDDPIIIPFMTLGILNRRFTHSQGHNLSHKWRGLLSNLLEGE